MSVRTFIFPAMIAGKAVLIPVSADIVAIAPDVDPPGPPHSLDATPEADGIALAWSSSFSGDTVGYNAYRAEGVIDVEGPPGTLDVFAKINLVGLIDGDDYLDAAAVAGVTYTYFITAVDLAGNESDHSDGAVATRLAPPGDDPPAAVMHLVATGTQTRISLGWDDNTEPDLALYRVYRAADAAGPFVIIASPIVSAYDDLDAPEGEVSYYRVTAVDAAGQESAPVDIAAERPVPPMGTSILFSSKATMSPATVHVYATPFGGQRYFSAPEKPGIVLASGDPLSCRYRWSFCLANGSPHGIFSALEGFNAAHLFEHSSSSAQQFLVKLEITQPNGAKLMASATLNVLPDTRTAVYVDAENYVTGTADSGDGTLGNPFRTLAAAAAAITGPDMKLVLARTTPGKYYALGSTIVLRFNNTLIDSYLPAGRVGANVAEIQWTGSKAAGAVIFQAAARDCTIRNLRIYVQNPVFNITTNVKLSSTSGGAQNFTLTALTIRQGIGSFFEQDTLPVLPPNGVFIVANVMPKRTCSVYGVAYVVGANYVIVGNNADEFGQHGVRIGGADNVLAAHNTLRRPRPPEDNVLARGILTAHVGRYLYFRLNTCSGGDLATGPLAIGDLTNKTDRAAWVVFERNSSTSIPTSNNGHFCGFHIAHGSQHLVLRNNVVDHNDWLSVQVEPFSDTYQRGVSDLFVHNNTFRNNGPTGTGLWVGAATLLRWRNNLYLAAVLDDRGKAVQSFGIDLAAFSGPGEARKAIDRNLWPPTLLKGGVPNANVFEVNAFATLALPAWNAYPPVGDDAGENTALQSQVDGVNWKPAASSIAATFGRPVPGVWEDFYGVARLASAATWSCGAAEA